MAGHRADLRGDHSCRYGTSRGRFFVKSWILLGVVVFATVMGDLLQSLEMKRHGEIRVSDPRGLGRAAATLATKKYLILAIFFMALSFFAFMTLMQTADLSFAVPAS